MRLTLAWPTHTVGTCIAFIKEKLVCDHCTMTCTTALNDAHIYTEGYLHYSTQWCSQTQGRIFTLTAECSEVVWGSICRWINEFRVEVRQGPTYAAMIGTEMIHNFRITLQTCTKVYIPLQINSFFKRKKCLTASPVVSCTVSYSCVVKPILLISACMYTVKLWFVYVVL